MSMNVITKHHGAAAPGTLNKSIILLRGDGERSMRPCSLASRAFGQWEVDEQERYGHSDYQITEKFLHLSFGEVISVGPQVPQAPDRDCHEEREDELEGLERRTFFARRRIYGTHGLLSSLT
jgi:hypothetical protein